MLIRIEFSTNTIISVRFLLDILGTGSIGKLCGEIDMALYLVQHGRSLPRDKDPEQGLSEEGIADLRRIAGVAAGYGVRPAVIWHSGKKRALQTAQILEAALHPAKGVEAVDGLNPLDDVRQFADRIDSNENVMLVGHLPFMERLTSYLVTGSVDMRVFRFQNGGIVCMDFDPELRSWFIKWALMPKID